MAKQIIHLLIDDIDGGEAEETVSFALENTQYTIDLSAANAARMRAAFMPYVKAGTRAGRMSVSSAAPVTRGSASASTRASRDENVKIREWATARGIEVSDRGRIKQTIVEQYNNRHAIEAEELRAKQEAANQAAAEQTAASNGTGGMKAPVQRGRRPAKKAAAAAK